MQESKTMLEERLRKANMMKKLALTVVFTALVFVVTSIFSMGLESSGYFNIGESMVYVAALVGGPFVGAFAGGVGSALADLGLGYPIYAPATLVLKGLEGFVAGYIFQAYKKSGNKMRFLLLGIIIVPLVGLTSWLANKTLEVGFSIAFTDKYYSYNIKGYWLLIVALILLGINIATLIVFKEKGKMAFACLTSGPIIIVGYFLYQVAIRNIINKTIEVIAGEIPFNILQVVIGVIIAVPIVTALQNMGVIEELSSTKIEEISIESASVAESKKQ